MGNKSTSYSEILIYVLIIIGISAIFIKTYYFFQHRIDLITCQGNITTLQQAVERFRTYRPEEVGDDTGKLKMLLLIKEKFLPVAVVCPENGVYKTDENKKVYCTVHGYLRGGE